MWGLILYIIMEYFWYLHLDLLLFCHFRWWWWFWYLPVPFLFFLFFLYLFLLDFCFNSFTNATPSPTPPQFFLDTTNTLFSQRSNSYHEMPCFETFIIFSLLPLIHCLFTAVYTWSSAFFLPLPPYVITMVNTYALSVCLASC